MIPLILPGAAFLVLLWAIVTYRRLISLRNDVRNAWKQVDIQLKFRHDLVPNLVSAVKGAMESEQDTLEKVMSARATAVASTVSLTIRKAFSPCLS